MRGIVSLLGGIAVVACGGNPAPGSTNPADVFLIVDSTAFHRQGQAALPVTYSVTNGGSATVYVAQCDGAPAAVADRWDYGVWRFYEGGFCNGGPQPPLALAPGTSASGVFMLYISGNFRLRLGTTSSPTGTDERIIASSGFDVF